MILCIDIGGTAIKYGLAPRGPEGPRWLFQKEIPTRAKELKGPGILRTVLELAARTEALEGLAISTAGMVDVPRGEIIYANDNIPEYRGINFKGAVEAEFGIPCWVENDVNAAALGEYAYGAGRGSHSLLCLTVGTGIGGAVILEGRIHRGFSQSAGEIGYMLIKGEMFEKIASASALVEGLRKETGNPRLDGKIIFAEAAKPVYARAIAALCDGLAQGIHNCACLLNPETVVLGGGIMEQKALLGPLLEAALGRYMSPFLYQNTKLAFAELGNGAGMAGAYHFWQCQEALPKA